MEKIKIAEITNPINGKTIKSSDWTSSGIPIIRIQNLNNRKSEFNYLKNEIEPQYMVDTGELLFAWSGTIGAFFWNGPRAALNQHIFRLPLDESKTDKNYLHYALNFIIDSIKSQMQGSAGSLMHITKSKFINTEIPHPPLTVQKVIASKIKTNFDLIENGISKLEKSQIKLQIFKQSILNSAIRGKLVPQDPKDEPASMLLERIQKEREKLVADKKIKKEKPLPPISEDETPFELPEGWAWVRLEEIANACLGKMLDKNKNKGTPEKYLRNINVRWMNFDLSDLLEMKFETSEKARFTVVKGDLLICEGGELEFPKNLGQFSQAV
jgi:type I restriction enzyme, S subunit